MKIIGETIFSFLGVGDGKKEKTVDEYLEVFRRNPKEQRRQRLINLSMLFVEECFLFSNLIFAVLYEIFEELHDRQADSTSHIQCFFAGDPNQLLVFDKDSPPGGPKNTCLFKGVLPHEAKGQMFSTFFETIMRTGLRVQFLMTPHRTTDPEFLEDLSLVWHFTYIYHIFRRSNHFFFS